MEKEVLVKVEGLSKKFARDLKKSLRYGLQDISRELLGRSRKTELRSSEFWAVQDVSFELRRGECLGLIGHNGAGKSTLLKILNGLIKPDAGRVEIKGRVAALIELGAGFNPILTGRENIYNNASVLGFSKEETDEKLDAIIEFSELGEFIDAPVQSYSSGMKVRLGFSVAAQLEPDVLFIDEVLAVGDVFFRNKCINRIGELKKKSAVIFVSHSINLVGLICTDAIVMDKGKVIFNSPDIGESYMKYLELRESNIGGDGESSLLNTIEIRKEGQKINVVQAYELVDIWLSFKEEINAFVSLVIFDLSQRPVLSVLNQSYENFRGREFILKNFKVDLVPGQYWFSVNVTTKYKGALIEKVMDVGEFKVNGTDFLWSPTVVKHEFIKLT